MKFGHPEIPQGDYCYDYGRGGSCPYFTRKTVPGTKVMLPWCNYLQRGSVPASVGSMTDADRAALDALWGEKTPVEWDLFLLWDACKECRENDGFRGYYAAPRARRPFIPNHVVELFVTGIYARHTEPHEFSVTVSVPKHLSPLHQVRVMDQIGRAPRLN